MTDSDKCPFVIGGVGGSGTRVFADILQKAGCYIGTRLNKAKDSQVFVPLYDKWIPRILAGDISQNEEGDLVSEMTDCVKEHRQEIPSGNISWGWKNPRSIYLLKYFQKLYPEIKFIHIIRDGRDMAFSQNQNQLNMYAKYILGQSELNQEPYITSMKFWSTVNLSVSDYCNKFLEENYLRIRFEDLCFGPEKTINEILAFCNIGGGNIESLAGLVRVPDSAGRWKTMDHSQITAVNRAGKYALEYFGYTHTD